MNPLPASIITEFDSALSDGAYIYNTSAQTVSAEADITFDTNAFLTSNITHVAGTSQIHFLAEGEYLISFSVSSTTANQFAVFKNNTVVPGSIYGTGIANVQNNGQAFVYIEAGDFITIRNHTSVLPVVLGTLFGGTQVNVNASVSILRLY